MAFYRRIRWTLISSKSSVQDETDLSIVQSKIPRVLGMEGKKIAARTSTERGATITTIAYMSAFNALQWLFSRPDGAVGRDHSSGWVQNNLFAEKTNPTTERPILLISDGHCSHVRNPHVIDMAKNNNVTILSLPPNSTHKRELLNKRLMRALKTYYRESLAAMERASPHTLRRHGSVWYNLRSCSNGWNSHQWI